MPYALCPVVPHLSLERLYIQEYVLITQQRMNVDCYRRDVEGLWVFSPTVRGTVWSWLVSIFSVQSLLCMRMFLDRVKSVKLRQSKEKAV